MNDERQQRLADRSDDVIRKNDAANGLHASLYCLQEIPDVEISFSADMGSWLRVRRQGITYGINKRSGPSTGGKLGRYVYAVGADLGDGLVFPHLRANCYGRYGQAVDAVRKAILFDPRQDGIPDHLRATHFVLEPASPVNSGP